MWSLDALLIQGIRCALGGKFQQFWNRFNIPVGMLGTDMAEIGGELDHLPSRINSISVPIYHSANSERMTEIVNTRPASVPSEPLRRAQSNALADRSKVISGATIAGTGSVVGDEEGLWMCAEKPVAFFSINDELGQRALRDRDNS